MVERKCGPGVSIGPHSTIMFVDFFYLCFQSLGPPGTRCSPFLAAIYSHSSSIIRAINILTWTAELVLRNVPYGTENGKLKIEVRNVKAEVGSGEQGYSWAPDDVKRQLEGVLEGVRSHIKNKSEELSDIMNHLQGDVDELFGKSWGFIFGGNNDFFIDRAGFNRRVP